MDFASELKALLDASVPLVQLVTYEEERVVRALQAAAPAGRLGIVVWDSADGFSGW